MKEKILVSSCLLGENVKYNGKNNILSDIDLKLLYNNFDLYSYCPEVEGGLSIPRVPCEIIDGKVINRNGEDKTKYFILGAKKTLELCKEHNIKKALLKANSPSCSSKYIYDGSFSSIKIEGYGITASLLKENGIEVYDEFDIEKLFNNK